MSIEDVRLSVSQFLLDKVGDERGFWYGKMKASDQRRLFGQYFGRGVIFIDGQTGQIDHGVLNPRKRPLYVGVRSYRMTATYYLNTGLTKQPGG